MERQHGESAMRSPTQPVRARRIEPFLASLTKRPSDAVTGESVTVANQVRRVHAVVNILAEITNPAGTTRPYGTCCLVPTAAAAPPATRCLPTTRPWPGPAVGRLACRLPPTCCCCDARVGYASASCSAWNSSFSERYSLHSTTDLPSASRLDLYYYLDR